jgi:hypothetical protein
VGLELALVERLTREVYLGCFDADILWSLHFGGGMRPKLGDL